MLATHLSRAFFKLCHGNQLVYNTCWEDPRLDRVALELGPGDRLLVITSAGCNALDYALDRPERIDTVDVNPRQNALLDLKLAAIKRLEYDHFFELFGHGKTDNWQEIYSDALRADLPESSRKFWDKNGKFFLGEGRRPSFYFRGSAGMFASGINMYINRWAKVREDIERLLAADTIEEQREIYYKSVKPAFWGKWIRWFLRRDAALSMLGVPRAQRQQLERYYPGGIAKFVEDSLDAVFTQLPLKDNYFWRVYLTGEYTPECCPEYLKPDNFAALKGTSEEPGLASRISTQTTTILDHLRSVDHSYSHFVLLDHMDWMAEHMRDVLAVQWQEIIDRSDDDARILWHSAAVICEFVDPIPVKTGGVERRLGEVLDYNRDLADELHAKDRVHTYGSFSIATLRREGVSTNRSAEQTTTEKAADAGAKSTKDSVSPDASPIRGETHEERLDSFYSGQADDYDAFRKKMLHGRETLFEALPIAQGGAWVDIGAGTARNGELFGERLAEFGSATFVDLSKSLLEVADRRIADCGWTNAHTLHADATNLELEDESAELVTFTYSLTMIPDWFAAIEEAYRVLKPGGVIGVVDFYVSRRYPAEEHRKHSYFARNFWPFWFGNDNVHPSADHLPMLERKFDTISLAEEQGKLPLLPIVRAPYYRFIGRKAEGGNRMSDVQGAGI